MSSPKATPILPFFSNFKDTRDQRLNIILIRGIEDLPEKTAEELGKIFGLEVFDSRWNTTESLDHKIDRLHRLVTKIIKRNQLPVFIGLSAGASIMMVYELIHPGQINLMYSIGGLLNPDLNSLDLSFLTNDHPGFDYASHYLTKNLNNDVAKKHHLPDKVFSYSSPNDPIVPLSASCPSWVKNYYSIDLPFDFGTSTHLISIITALKNEILPRISQLHQLSADSMSS